MVQSSIVVAERLVIFRAAEYPDPQSLYRTYSTCIRSAVTSVLFVLTVKKVGRVISPDAAAVNPKLILPPTGMS